MSAHSPSSAQLEALSLHQRTLSPARIASTVQGPASPQSSGEQEASVSITIDVPSIASPTSEPLPADVPSSPAEMPRPPMKTPLPADVPSSPAEMPPPPTFEASPPPSLGTTTPPPASQEMRAASAPSLHTPPRMTALHGNAVDLSQMGSDVSIDVEASLSQMLTPPPAMRSSIASSVSSPPVATATIQGPVRMQPRPIRPQAQAPRRSLPTHAAPPRRRSAVDTPQTRLPMFVAPSREELQQVRQIVHLLHRAYQAFEFYPLNHPIVQQFSRQMFELLQGFFRHREMLELRLDRFQVRYGDQIIFEEQSLTSNFVYLLYSDGIRKLIIDAGLTHDEYIRFFMVLHRSSTRRSVNEDTITLLWEQQFAHIRYFLVEDLTELFLPDLQSLYDNMNQQAQAASAASSITGSQEAVQVMTGLAHTRLDPSPDERAALQHLLQDEERGLMRRFLEIVARVLEHEEDVLQLDRLVRVLSQLHPILLSVGEIEHLALCLYYTSRLSQVFAQRHSAQAQQWHSTLQKILAEAYSDKVIQKLITLLDQNPNNESLRGEVERYLQWLSPPTPEVLLKGFSWSESFVTRQFWCQCLVQKYPDQPRQFASGIVNQDPVVVRYVCMILGELAHPAGRPLLQRAAKHNDPSVRAEATRALIQLGGGNAALPQLVSLLRKNLADSDPEVRRSALQGLGQLGKRCLPLLEDLYTNRIFESWEHDDQRLLFDTTVRLGQRHPESIEILAQALLKTYSGWLAGRRDAAFANLAIQSLQRNGNPRAIQAIEALYNEGSGALRTACEAVVRRF